MKSALTFTAALLTLLCAMASARAAAPGQDPSRPSDGNGQPLGGGKAVTTTTVKRCTDGRELVLRANGRYGCAKDILPPNE